MSVKRNVVLLVVLAAVGALFAAAGGSAATDAVGCTIRGTSGNDVLRGTARSDVICGFGGRDTIRGGGGNDTLIGGAGNDTIVGGNGLDLMVGGPGNDSFFAAGGRADRLNGGPGRDRAVVDSRDRLVSIEVRTVRPSGGTATNLPPLPTEVRSRGRWVVGVKCDAPPFGYIDVRGQNAGFDVEIARWFSRYAFGRENRVDFICAPTPAREPLLTTGRADLVISTFTYTRDRDTRIDFSRAYYKATGRMLVRENGPIRSLRDLPGRTVVTTSGSIYDRWVRRCFPTANLIVTDNLTNARLAFEQGRADTLMWDDTVLVGMAAADRSVRLTPDTFLALPYGIGIREGHTAMKRWVDARLELMRRADRFMPILQNTVPARFVGGFSNNILRPNNTFGYAPENAPAPDTVCQ